MTTIADIPLGYSYINFSLGALVSETGWENLTYIFIAQDAMRALEITEEPTETADIFAYYAALKYKALDYFKRELSTAYDYTADGESYKRSQMFAQVSELVKEAKAEAKPYLSAHAVSYIEQGVMTFPDDPYSIDGQYEHDIP